MASGIKCLLICLLVFCTCENVTSYKQYQNLVPNGDNVPHSCKQDHLWHGVGHNNFIGGGPLNRFGRDFKTADHVWKDVCNLDSDGDGVTNGKELGDPNCVWQKGQLPERISNITNPGVCDPVNSKACEGRNYFLKCETEKQVECPELHEEGVRNVTIRFPSTKIPTKKTYYNLMAFDLPQDGDYHLISVRPFIVNTKLVHHILVFGCSEYDNPSRLPVMTPIENYNWPPCAFHIGGWSMGSKHRCENMHDRKFGIRFGAKKGLKRAMIQIHWNNPDGISDYTDSSGVILYYTSKLREHDKGNIIAGPEYLNIPPGRDRVPISGLCSSACTSKYMKGPIYIYSVSPHMHYLGRAMKTELYRNGTQIAILSVHEDYTYDHKNLAQVLKKPVKMLPGDEIITTCVYSSKYQKKPTYWSRGIDGEMCLSFFAYYPAENTAPNNCFSYKHSDVCHG